MRFRLLLVVAVAGLCISALDAAAAEAPITDNAFFSVPSNGSWRGAKPAPFSPLPRGTRTLGGVYLLVWAPTCSAKRQTLVFTRRVDLAGPPSRAGVAWALGSQDSFTRFLESFELLVNGKTVYKKTGGTSDHVDDLPASALGAFDFGENTLTVRAVAAPSSKASDRAKGTCNRGAGPKFGLSFSISGELTAELSFGSKPGVPATKNEYVRATGWGGAAEFAGEFHNWGPSGVRSARLEVRVRPERQWRTFGGQVTVDGKLGNCIDVTGAAGGSVKVGTDLIIQCTLGPIKPKARIVIGFNVKFVLPSIDFAESGYAVSFEVRRTDGGVNRGGNSSFGWIVAVCGTKATSSACASAK